MKKLNNKGFTLIELLAVVVILLAISVMAISSISAAIERNKVKQNNAKIDVILSYAELYYEAHRNSLNSRYPSGDGCIELSELDLSDSESVDADDNAFAGVVTYDKDGNFVFDKSKDSCS